MTLGNKSTKTLHLPPILEQYQKLDNDLTYVLSDRIYKS